MGLIEQLADLCILRPTNHPIDSGGQKEIWLSRNKSCLAHSSSGRPSPNARRHSEIQSFVWESKLENSNHRLLVIKFPGTAGRAERSTPHPSEVWRDADSVVLTVNPFGYGASPGPAALRRIGELVQCVFEGATELYPNRKIVVCGNSLGSLAAFKMARDFPVHGLLLRNPVPIHQLVKTRPRYWFPSLGVNRVIAKAIPHEVDTVENARHCHLPAVFVCSENDRVVPPKYQQLIHDNYVGPKQIVLLPNAGHASVIPEEAVPRYQDALNWLLGRVDGNSTHAEESIKSP